MREIKRKAKGAVTERGTNVVKWFMVVDKRKAHATNPRLVAWVRGLAHIYLDILCFLH